MAHPYSEHRDHKVGKSRASTIARGKYATGGAVKLAKPRHEASQIREDDMRPEGGKTKHRMDRPRRAKGGRVGKKGSTVNVIVNASPKEGGPAMLPPPPMGGPMAPPPPMPRPPMGPPGPGVAAGPTPGLGGAGMPPPPMRAKGGRVKSGPAWDEGKRLGTQVSHDPGKNDGKDIGRKKVVTFATGGKVKSFSASTKANRTDMGEKPAGQTPSASNFKSGGRIKREDGGAVDRQAAADMLAGANTPSRLASAIGKVRSSIDSGMEDKTRASGGRVGKLESTQGTDPVSKRMPGGGGGGLGRLEKVKAYKTHKGMKEA